MHLLLINSCLLTVYVCLFISLVEYRGIEPGTEREIFQRVQMGMPLTAAGTKD